MFVSGRYLLLTIEGCTRHRKEDRATICSKENVKGSPLERDQQEVCYERKERFTKMQPPEHCSIVLGF